MIAIVGGPTRGNLCLVEGLRRLGLRASLLAGEGLHGRVSRGDVVLGRLDVLPTLDGVEPGLLELLRLERSGARTLNRAGALLAAHDKLRTWRMLAAAGVPQPSTRHARTLAELRALPLPVVIKPRFGSWGADVERCRDAAELERCLAGLPGRGWFRRHGAIVQELFLHEGSDLRLVVAGGEVVGAVERTPAPGEWRTNVSLGASVRAVEPPEDACRLGLLAATSVACDLVGVDLLPVGDGWVVLELNGCADFDSAYSLAGHDVYADIARVLGLGGPAEPVRDAPVP
jgi:[lysine-biosynthesis-protein LysW]--L-2-aminoadipate ligase